MRSDRQGPHPLVALVALALGSCGVSPPASTRLGPPVIHVSEQVDSLGTASGFGNGRLVRLVDGELRKRGLRTTSDAASANVEIVIDLRLLDMGDGYAGFGALSVYEPAILLRTHESGKAITMTKSFVFTTPRDQLDATVERPLVRDADAVARDNPRLRPR